MKNLRKYGKPPYSVVVIHGGPGAPGQMAPVAKKLSLDQGVLEPLQTATSLEGQVQELRDVLEDNGSPPFTLIGSSWGAMLGFIFTAYHPDFVKKLILVGSAVFEKKYAGSILETRLSRLSRDENKTFHSLMEALEDPSVKNKNKPFTQLAWLCTKADAYHPISLDTEILEAQFSTFQTVWKDAEELRYSGELLQLANKILCPVVALHGDFDPHPAEGVQKPLLKVLNSFRFILLKNCGHLPWIEKEAQEDFYRLIKEELS